MARANIRDVAAAAGLSVSTVNRALHEPDKLREETIHAVLQAAESVGFYGIGSIRESLKSMRPKSGSVCSCCNATACSIAH